MNPSNLNSKRISVIIAILSIVLVWWLHMQYALPGADGSNMSIDAKSAYALDIDTEAVTDWHSSLFGHECILLKHAALFVGFPLNGLECIQIAIFIAITLALVSCLYLILVFHKSWWVCLILPVSFFIIFRFNGAHVIWRHDHLFLYLLVPLIANIVALYRAHDKKLKFLFLFFIILLLWHCVSLRKNSMVIVPIVAGAVLVCLNKTLIFDMKKIILKALICTICFCSAVFLVDSIMPVNKTYPISPMLISDVRIARILRGEPEIFFEQNPEVVRYGASIRSKERKLIGPYNYDYGIAAYWHLIHDFENCSVCKLTNNRNVLHGSSPYSMYMENLKTMPLDMCVAKIIQIAQLYRLDHFPVPFERVIKEMYPHAFEHECVYYPDTFSIKYMLMIWGTFVLLMLTSGYSIIRIKKGGGKDSGFCLFHIFISCLALVYAASFIVVTPTSDYRYLMPSICLGQLVILVWSIHFIKRKLKFVA